MTEYEFHISHKVAYDWDGDLNFCKNCYMSTDNEDVVDPCPRATTTAIVTKENRNEK